jgi:mRNA interferase YafQ
MKYEIKFTTRFKRDSKLVARQGKDLAKLRDVVLKLADKVPLEERFHDHELVGEYRGFRECHIEPDWLLIYEYYEDMLILSLTRTGSHSDLFR